MKKRLPTIILILTFFVGFGILLYPAVSNYINQKHQSRAIEAYNETIAGMNEEQRAEAIALAKEYNEQLYNTPDSFYGAEQIQGYDDLLNISGNGIMGYLSIEKIRVELPVYHGTPAGVLNNAAGHLEGTSLPVGGENTHCVFSAHRGLPGAKLFTDLDRLEEGDIFTVTVLGETYTYQVDRIRTVEPHDVAELQTIPGKDYCTLLTCTPYGINTHRLLVRGCRIENIEEKSKLFVTSDAYQIDTIIAAPAVAAPMLLILLIKLMLPQKKKNSEESDQTTKPSKKRN